MIDIPTYIEQDIVARGVLRVTAEEEYYSCVEEKRTRCHKRFEAFVETRKVGEAPVFLKELKQLLDAM